MIRAWLDLTPCSPPLATTPPNNGGESEWRQFGRETGTSDIVSSLPRLYRSLSFGDDDYPDAALEILGRVLDEGVEDRGNEAERMELLADAMPDLPTWTIEHAPNRTKRLFRDYLDARDPSEIPNLWSGETPTLPSPVPPTAETFDWSTPATDRFRPGCGQRGRR